MTCIIGIIDGKSIHMGADSCIASSQGKMVSAFRKIFKKGELLIASTGSLRTSQLIQYQLTSAERPEHISDQEYIIVYVVEAMRELLKNHGDSYKTSERESSPNEFLIGYRGALYVVEYDYGVTSHANTYNAIGSGESFALGSLYSTRFDDDVNHRILTALGAASCHARGVAEPFFIESLHYEEHDNGCHKTKKAKGEVISLAAHR